MGQGVLDNGPLISITFEYDDVISIHKDEMRPCDACVCVIS